MYIKKTLGKTSAKEDTFLKIKKIKNAHNKKKKSCE